MCSRFTSHIWIAALIATAPFGWAADSSPTTGPRFTAAGGLKAVAADEKSQALFTLSGQAVEGELGDARREPVGRGIRLLSSAAVISGAAPAGSATWTVQGIKPEQGRWFRLRVRGMAQEDFKVEEDAAFLRIEFFKDGGSNSVDHVTKSIYQQIERDRQDLADKGTNANLGAATWRNYTVQFRTPFPEVDTFKLAVGFANGAGGPRRSEFWVSEVEIAPIPDPSDYAPPAQGGTAKSPSAMNALVKLGGRWYYDPRGSGGDPPQQFDASNVDRLYYLSDRLETPFAGNTTAWLRKGYLDLAGKPVEKDQFVPDNVLISFTKKHLVIKSKNLPNHPTAVFPDHSRLLDGNPNYIQEQNFTWYIPLEPKVNPRHVAMDAENKNLALPGGPIGVAINGIIFHNPFDERVRMDAVWRLDRCCGHPSPVQRYHYHKYPVCVNTPWADDGREHSLLIGFAFDGFPVYGPYEAAGVLAKDSKQNPLNEFNLHQDDARGPHYHVTPGKYPHLIGGFWGDLDPLNRTQRGPPPR